MFPDDHLGYSVFKPWWQASIEAGGTGLEHCLSIITLSSCGTDPLPVPCLSPPSA